MQVHFFFYRWVTSVWHHTCNTTCHKWLLCLHFLLVEWSKCLVTKSLILNNIVTKLIKWHDTVQILTLIWGYLFFFLAMADLWEFYNNANIIALYKLMRISQGESFLLCSLPKLSCVTKFPHWKIKMFFNICFHHLFTLSSLCSAKPPGDPH